MTAIEMCTNRFDDETKTAFMDLYSKVDETVEGISNATPDANDAI